jgi:hypothetical protein
VKGHMHTNMYLPLPDRVHHGRQLHVDTAAVELDMLKPWANIYVLIHCRGSARSCHQWYRLTVACSTCSVPCAALYLHAALQYLVKV